jgi:hypothetical protein
MKKVVIRLVDIKKPEEDTFRMLEGGVDGVFEIENEGYGSLYTLELEMEVKRIIDEDDETYYIDPKLSLNDSWGEKEIIKVGQKKSLELELSAFLGKFNSIEVKKPSGFTFNMRNLPEEADLKELVQLESLIEGCQLTWKMENESDRPDWSKIKQKIKATMIIVGYAHEIEKAKESDELGLEILMETVASELMKVAFAYPEKVTDTAAQELMPEIVEEFEALKDGDEDVIMAETKEYIKGLSKKSRKKMMCSVYRILNADNVITDKENEFLTSMLHELDLTMEDVKASLEDSENPFF